jgi:hypothetical protein
VVEPEGRLRVDFTCSPPAEKTPETTTELKRIIAGQYTIRVMSSGLALHRQRIRLRQRLRCGARIKNPLKRRAHGVTILRDPFCKAWSMENGRCRVHGGASTGPRSPEGKARVVAAMVVGRRKWVARRRAEGRPFIAGRKGGEAWVTEAMRERARTEARRLGAGRFTLDRSLTLALLKSAKGDPVARAKAKAILDAHERAEANGDREQALAIVNRLRATATARRSEALQSVKIGSDVYAAGVEAPRESDADDVPVKFWRNVNLALDLLGKILSQPITEVTSKADRRLAAKAAAITMKAAIATDKNVLKAPRAEFPLALKFPQNC